ncbi:DUF317 domain-containing protein [Streptomyces rhizosphaericus]|uniref:DUF317 domain-containing protein n=1 Tax=Streptomyces rhizosphaericus TaxID=114699 RepID=UPI002892A6E3|nr:DUF317 domain-containing protein [Streptomyces rhizosphaericus]
MDGRWTRWTNPSEDARIQLDAFATWTIWAGPSIDRVTWTLHASPSIPAPVFNDLAHELAHNSISNHRRAAQRTARRITTPHAHCPRTVVRPEPVTIADSTVAPLSFCGRAQREPSDPQRQHPRRAAEAGGDFTLALHCLGEFFLNATSRESPPHAHPPPPVHLQPFSALNQDLKPPPFVV